MDVPTFFPGYGFLISRPDPFARFQEASTIFKDQKSEMIRCMALKWSFWKYFKMKKRRLIIFSVNSGGFPQALELRDLAHQFAAEDPEFVLLLVVKEFESTKQRLLLPFQLLTKSSWKGSWGERLRALVVVKSISWQFLSSSFNCYLSPPPYCNLFAPLIQPAIHLPTFKHLNCLDLHVPTSAFPPCSFHEFSHLPNAKPQVFLHFQKFKSVSPFPIVPKDRPHPVARGGRTFESLQVYTTILRNLCWCHPSYRKTHIYIQLRNAETYDKYIFKKIWMCEIYDKYIWIPTWPRHFETRKSMFNPLKPYDFFQFP